MSAKRIKHDFDYGFVIEQIKFEIAQELGIQLPPDGYYGHITSHEIGKLGGHITKRLALLDEQKLSNM